MHENKAWPTGSATADTEISYQVQQTHNIKCVPNMLFQTGAARTLGVLKFMQCETTLFAICEFVVWYYVSREY